MYVVFYVYWGFNEGIWGGSKATSKVGSLWGRGYVEVDIGQAGSFTIHLTNIDAIRGHLLHFLFTPTEKHASVRDTECAVGVAYVELW